MKKIKLFSAFTGVGTTEMGLRELGLKYENVGTSEVDKNAMVAFDAIHNDTSKEVKLLSKEDMIKALKEVNTCYNFSTGASELPRSEKEVKKIYSAFIRNKNYGDIRLINADKLPDFDLFSYTYPCKNISIAGKKEGFKPDSDTASSLVWECEKIIKAKKPSILLMENVRNLVAPANMIHFEAWIEILNSLGYKSFWKVLNGDSYDAPQSRKRVIMVSYLESEKKEDFMFPEGELTSLNISDILENEVDVPKNLFYEPKRYSHINIFPSKREKKILKIGNIDNKTHSNTRVYSEHGYAPTLNSMNGGNRQPKIAIKGSDGVHYVRRMTTLECWRAMGYLDSDHLLAKEAGLADSKLYERAGRGIVLPMLKEIINKIDF